MKNDTTINVNLYINPAPLGEVRSMFEQIIQQLTRLTTADQQEAQAMSALEDQVTALEAKTKAESDAITAGEGLLSQISQLYKDALAAGGNSDAIVARIQAVNLAVDAKTSEFAAAIVANTPAAPTT